MTSAASQVRHEEQLADAGSTGPVAWQRRCAEDVVLGTLGPGPARATPSASVTCVSETLHMKDAVGDQTGLASAPRLPQHGAAPRGRDERPLGVVKAIEVQAVDVHG